MCEGTIIQFWCPCQIENEDHYRYGEEQIIANPAHFRMRFTTEGHRKRQVGHALVNWVDTGAFRWCDEYFKSPSFSLAPTSGPPNCPSGRVTYVRDAILSTKSLCDFCVRSGCVMPPRDISLRPSGSYGTRSVEERREAAQNEADRVRKMRGEAAAKSSSASQQTRTGGGATTDGASGSIANKEEPVELRKSATVVNKDTSNKKNRRSWIFDAIVGRPHQHTDVSTFSVPLRRIKVESDKDKK
ncbi:hypothetical protein QBC43DRAFT_330687 [Cladorrhinum sp. PSN259]|nr:hypothetical protein QBC43DRAFT_330687 [Cladorrhinum sp. PSN259]